MGRQQPKSMYGVPYMAISGERFSSEQSNETAAPAGVPRSECLCLTLRGFSPRELRARAEQECACHFGQCEWTFEEAEVVPCLGSLGGRVRLYEGRFVAHA